MRIIGGIFLPGTTSPLRLPLSTHRKLKERGCVEQNETEGWLVRIDQVETAAAIALEDVKAGIKYLTKQLTNELREQVTHQTELCVLFAAAVLDHQKEQIIELQDEIQELEEQEPEHRCPGTAFEGDIPF